MTQRFTIQQRLRYRFDNTLSRGLWAVLAWLGVVSLLFFLVIAGLLSLTGLGPQDQGTSFLEGLWFAITRSLDPGTFSGDEGNRFRFVMLIVTVAGIFLAATIIGLISSAIDNRVEALRRGRSLVVEREHTLLIGDSDKLPAVIAELVEANASRRDRAIVVMTAEDTVEVSESLHGAVPNMGTSRLVVRSGVPTRLSELVQVNPQGASSAIVLKPRDGNDAHVVKVVLALAQCVPGLQGLTVVAEIDDPTTASALKEALGPSLITITSKDIIARISAQVSRAAGLGAIYQELLDFEGDELYSVEVTGPWVGRTFGEALLASSAATIVGIRRGDGEVAINPDVSLTLQAGDYLVGIAADDSVFHLDCAPVDWVASTDRVLEPLPKAQERTLLIGWSDLAPLIGNEIEAHVAPGSALHVMVAEEAASDDEIHSSMSLSMQTLQVHRGDPISGPAIEAVMQQGPFDHVMLLSERERYSSDEADARTLLSLLHVRRCAAEVGGSHNIVAELLDPNDVDLGGKTEGDDFIVSQKLIGLLMAQLSESPHLAEVFEDLFNSDGSIVAMHPVQRYLPTGTHTFADVVRSTREWNVVPIGYRAASAIDDPAAVGNGIRLNPPKEEPIVFGEADMVVVLAEP